MRHSDTRKGDVIEDEGGDRFIVVSDGGFEAYIGNRDPKQTNTEGFYLAGCGDEPGLKIIGRLEMFDGRAPIEKQRDGSTVAKSEGNVDLRDVLQGR
jgi:hypothetical protein